jgi:Lipid A 3-O-deacylase (PagL)
VHDATYTHHARETERPLPKWIFRLAGVLALLSFAGASHIAGAQSLCESCEVQIGLGGTYHFWGTTGGVVLPIVLNWDDSRYELGFFRVTTQQVLYDKHSPFGRLMADPYWGASLSRRWRVYEKGPVRLFFGFGFAAKTESDQLSSTRVDFAEQLGLRFRLPGNRVTAELTMRHWSNGGIRLPNHGQDFATLTVKVNTGKVGVSKADAIPLGDLQ